MRIIGCTIVCLTPFFVGLVPAQAQSSERLNGNLLTILGITSPDAPVINYRDRPPLVVPPKSTLPPPQDGEARRGGINWPNDPDSPRNRQARAAAEAEVWEEKIRRGGAHIRLSPEDTQRIRARAQPGAVLSSDGNIMYGPMSAILESNRRSAAKEANELPIGAEPPRRNLLEPPVGLRTATQRVRATADAPAPDSRERGEVRSFIDEQTRR